MGISRLIGLIWLSLVVAALAGSVVWCVIQKRYAMLSWQSIGAAVMPGVIMVGSFYTLAIHMYASLGGWPTTLGESGLSQSLVMHADWTLWYFEAMILTVLFAWPIALVVCIFFSQLRRFIAPLSLFGVSFALCFILMLLGPAGFQNWWWD